MSVVKDSNAAPASTGMAACWAGAWISVTLRQPWSITHRGGNGDVIEAEAAIERLAAAPAEEGVVMRDIWLLRLRALLARAHSDAAAYTDSRLATETWRKRLVSRGISTGPRQCHDRDGIGLLIVWHRAAAKREVLFGVRRGRVDSGETG